MDAAAAMYHPDASIVQVDEVHGGSSIARGADGIRKTMAAYVGLKPHMDVVTHHTTVSGDFAMTRSQWLIKGTGKDGKPTEGITTAWRFTAGCPTAAGCSSWIIRSAPIRAGRS